MKQGLEKKKLKEELSKPITGLSSRGNSPIIVERGISSPIRNDNASKMAIEVNFAPRYNR